MKHTKIIFLNHNFLQFCWLTDDLGGLFINQKFVLSKMTFCTALCFAGEELIWDAAMMTSVIAN